MVERNDKGEMSGLIRRRSKRVFRFFYI